MSSIDLAIWGCGDEAGEDRLPWLARFGFLHEGIPVYSIGMHFQIAVVFGPKVSHRRKFILVLTHRNAVAQGWASRSFRALPGIQFVYLLEKFTLGGSPPRFCAA